MEEPYLTFRRRQAKPSRLSKPAPKRAKAEGSGTGAAPLPAGIMPTGAGLENGRDFGPVVGRGKGLASGHGGLIA